jgi:hypothetical protein
MYVTDALYMFRFDFQTPRPYVATSFAATVLHQLDTFATKHATDMCVTELVRCGMLGDHVSGGLP